MYSLGQWAAVIDPDGRRTTNSGESDVKIFVDHDRCEGHSRCMEIAPELFEVRDDDRSHVLIDDPGEELREVAERALRMCPRQAISTVD
jgi:ferredoxin